MSTQNKKINATQYKQGFKVPKPGGAVLLEASVAPRIRARLPVACFFLASGYDLTA